MMGTEWLRYETEHLPFPVSLTRVWLALGTPETWDSFVRIPFGENQELAGAWAAGAFGA